MEFALLLPVLALLVFGIIDFGLLFSDMLQIRQASREGARQAAVGVVDEVDTCPSAAAVGGAAGDLICHAKASAGLGNEAAVRIQLGPGGHQVGEPVAVCVQMPMDSTSGLFSIALDGRVMESITIMRIETIGPEVLTSTGDPPISGHTWAGCTAS